MNPADRDALFDRQLQDYIGWRVSHAPGAPDLATMTTRVSAAVDMRARRRSTTLRALAIAAALASLTMLAIGGALVGGTLSLDSLRADVPLTAATSSPHDAVSSPRTTALPTPAPTIAAPAVAAQAFTSPVYGYSIHPPEGWEFSPATAAWDGKGPWGASEADFARPSSLVSGRRLTIVSTRLPAGETGDSWIDAHAQDVPVEYKDGRCVFITSGTGSMTTEDAGVSVTDGVIGGHPAHIRTICGHITGTVIVDDRVYQLSLFVDRRPHGDKALFDAVMATVDFDPQTPAEMPGTIESERYGYALDVPDGWQLAEPATATWTRPGPWVPGEADRYTRTGITRTAEIATRHVPAGMSAIDFVGQYVPRRGGADDSETCSYSGGPITGPFIGGPSPVWVEVRPEPRRTLVRATCSAMDGVVFIDGTAYVLQLPQSDMLLWIFDELLSGLGLDVPPVTFTSPRYGYTIDVPGGWQALPASRSWTIEGRPTASDVADAFVDWHHVFVDWQQQPMAHLIVAARSRPAGMSDDRFVADAAPLPATVRTDGSTVRCIFDERVVERGPIPPWQTDVIGGHPAQVRSMCGTVDAVVFVGERGYLLTLVSGTGTTGELGRFRELVATLRFDDGLQTFVSDAFGYALRYPPDWSVAAASVGWAGGAPPRQATDRLVAPKSTAELTVTARELADGMTEDQWINANVPAIVGGARCPSGGLTAPVLGLDWLGTTIDGRSARVRDACAQVDGVVFADGVGYWLRLTSSEPRKGGDVALFDRLMASIDLDAVAPTLVASGSQAGRTASETFSSRRYGYTIRYPADWTVEAATKRWSGAGSWKANMADQLSGPESAPLRFTVAARAAPEGVDPAWLGLYVPKPAAAQGRTCVKNGSHFIGVSALSAWTETTVAGRPARMRSGCGDVQAVLAEGETAYVLALSTPTMLGGEDAFRQIADTFRIAP